MENREIILINTGISGVGLFDINRRIYSIPLNGRLRISANSFRDIVDYPASRGLLLDGHVKVQGATKEMLLDSGLTDKEIAILTDSKNTDSTKSVVTNETPKVSVATEITEEIEESGEVKAVTYYNWISNNKVDKIKESLANKANVETLKGIVAKNEKYNTEEIQKLLTEVE